MMPGDTRLASGHMSTLYPHFLPLLRLGQQEKGISESKPTGEVRCFWLYWTRSPHCGLAFALFITATLKCTLLILVFRPVVLDMSAIQDKLCALLPTLSSLVAVVRLQDSLLLPLCRAALASLLLTSATLLHLKAIDLVATVSHRCIASVWDASGR